MPRGTYNRTKEWRKNHSKVMKGRKLTPEHKAKIAIKMKARKHTWGDKISAGKKGKKPYEMTNEIRAKFSRPGKLHPNWKGGVTSQTRLDRIKFARLYSPQVLARDNFTCQICFQYGGYLHADHIKSWKEYPELRFDINNCRTLCRPCHYYVTFKYKLPRDSRWGILANNVFK